MSKELAGEGDLAVTRAQNRNYCLADGFLRIARQSNGWTLFLRYQAQSERLYRRSLEEFTRLKALRPELPNEPISGPQPQPESTISPTSGTNPSPPQDASPPPSAAVPRPVALALVRAASRLIGMSGHHRQSAPRGYMLNWRFMTPSSVARHPRHHHTARSFRAIS
jgi:hypothetical protein